MLVRHTATYLGGNVATALFGFLGVFLYTRLLNPDEYGVYVLGTTAGGILAAGLFGWVRFSLVRYQSEGDHVDVRPTALIGYLGSATLLLLGTTAAVFLIGLPAPIVVLAALFCLTVSFFDLSQEVMRARLNAGQVMRSSILRSVSAFAIGLTIVLFGGGGLGLLLGVSLAFMLIAALYAGRIWNSLKRGFERDTLFAFLKLGAPTALSGFVFSFSGGLDRLAIGYFLSKSAVGEYGASADLVRQIISIPAMSVAAAVLPLAVRLLASEGAASARSHLEKSGELLLAIVGPMSIGLAIVSPALAAIMLGADFRSTAQIVMPVLALTALVSSLNQAYVHASFHLAKAPRLILAQGFLMLGTSLLVIYPMVTAFGVLGGALTLATSEAVGLVGGVLLARRAFPLPFAPARIARIGVALAVMSLATIVAQASIARVDLLGLTAAVLVGVTTYGACAFLLNIAQCRSLFSRGRAEPGAVSAVAARAKVPR